MDFISGEGGGSANKERQRKQGEILRKFYILNNFKFAFLSATIYISQAMLSNMSLN